MCRRSRREIPRHFLLPPVTILPIPNRESDHVMSRTRRILVTAALPYANGPIHLGHLVEYIQTDIWVRYQRLRGHRCIYICADDTHGTAIMIRARQEGRSEEELIGQMQRRARAGLRSVRYLVRQLRQHAQPGESRVLSSRSGRRFARPAW